MVVIKGIKMPKNCGECDCSYWHDYCGTYFCSLTGNNVLENQKDMDCPLVEIEERKVGKWIRISGGCKCPLCDMAFSRLKEDCSDNFCPNCGAEMRGNEK